MARLKTTSQLLANALAAYRQQRPTPAKELQTWIGVTLPLAENHLGIVQEVAQDKRKR